MADSVSAACRECAFIEGDLNLLLSYSGGLCLEHGLLLVPLIIVNFTVSC